MGGGRSQGFVRCCWTLDPHGPVLRGEHDLLHLNQKTVPNIACPNGGGTFRRSSTSAVASRPERHGIVGARLEGRPVWRRILAIGPPTAGKPIFVPVVP